MSLLPWDVARALQLNKQGRSLGNPPAQTKDGTDSRTDAPGDEGRVIRNSSSLGFAGCWPGPRRRNLNRKVS